MMEKNCLNCKYYDQPSFEMKERCWECLRKEELYTRWERKPITNADRIRAMSDEELAEYLDGICHDFWQMFVKDPQKMWLDWLKQEVE